MKSVAHDILSAYKNKEWDLETLELYIKILRQISQVHSIPAVRLNLSKMTNDWLGLSGHTEPKILKKLSGVVNTETASIGVGSPFYFKDIEEAYIHYSEKNILNLMNAGKAFIFDVGGDGSHNAQLRVVEGSKPLLTRKEFKFVVEATETAVVNIPDGVITLGDPCQLEAVRQEHHLKYFTW